jgi:hypothetical protein
MADDEQPPLFAGEPEHCSLCGEAGHTHDDHWLFELEPVQKLKGQLDSVTTELKEILDLYTTAQRDARRRFIREAAIYIYAEPAVGVDAPRAWTLAKALWDAKPEDC